MSGDWHGLWAYLSASPLMGLTATLLAYQAAHWLWRKGRMTPLLNPVLISITAISGFLTITNIDYPTYFDGAKFVHFLLGPAVVALAVPLYRHLRLLITSLGAVLTGLLAGSLTAALSALGVAALLGGSRETLLSLAPKSASSPIAMGIAEKIGGQTALAAVMAILTGIIGAMIGPWVLDRIKVTDERARGLAMGAASHGIGTARALQMGEVTGAFSGLGMGLNGLLTAILVPLLVSWLF